MTTPGRESERTMQARAGYRILGSIASGGMGTVSLALCVDESGAASPIAVKRLHASRAEDPESVAMFLDEARIASRIAHPNVLRIRDVERLGEELVILMEYVEGVSLGQLLRSVRDRGEELPVSVTRRILHDVLLGLHAAHELVDEGGKPVGIVHRDVSPHNLLVGSEGLTRVADFGIALASGRLASTQSEVHVKGKLRYLSPEQIYRRKIDRRVDLFASGIVLWECLTGRKLFAAGTEGETLAMILREPIAPPSLSRFDVPLDLDEACLKALERDPERRFATARAFADALESGPLATRKEIAALVERCEGNGFEERRALLRDGLRAPESKRDRPKAVASRAPATIAPAQAPKRKMRGVLATAALIVAGLVGACGARWAEPRREATLPAEIAPPPPAAEPVVAPTLSTTPPPPLHVDLDTRVAGEEVAAAKPERREAPRSPKAKSKPAALSTGTKRGPPERPFMPSDL